MIPFEINFTNTTMIDNNFYGGSAFLFAMGESFILSDALISNSCFHCAEEEAVESLIIIDRGMKPETQNCDFLFEEVECLQIWQVFLLF